MWTRVAVFSLLTWSAASAQTPVISIQQAFDQATVPYQAAKWPEALTAYIELERRSTKPGRSLSITSVRKGIVLRQLGRYEEAQLAGLREICVQLSAETVNSPGLV